MKADVSKTCDIFDLPKECYHRRHFFFTENRDLTVEITANRLVLHN